MQSIQSRLMNLLLRLLRTKKMFGDFYKAEHKPEKFQEILDKAHAGRGYQSKPADALVHKHLYEQVDIDGFALHIHQIGRRQKVVLSLHGGAYVLGIATAHWGFVEKVGMEGDCHIAVFDYPLAPEYTCTAVLEKTLKAYDLLVERYGVENVVLMGDSAGGGLAMALSLYLRDIGRPQPKSTILLYPWLDVTMSHSETRSIDSKDLILGIDGLITCGKFYAGERETTDPLVSPWFGDLAGVAPVYVFTGTWDVLHPQGRDFVEKVRSAGGEAELFAYPEMQHAWLLFGMPETKKAIEDICYILR
ncbi:MAG: monoterpene epsilon-lactone hydrolase [Cellvibrionaceae bacterium]|jgi:monoterpene epsilon-lactone hydrolase